MIEEDKKISEDLLSEEEEEIKRAEELLSASRSKRKKILAGEPEAEPKAEKESTPNSLIARCKANPVIPISFIAAVAVLVFGIIYFSSIMFTVDSLGFTYQELQANYKSTGIYEGLFKDFDCDLPKITYNNENAVSENKDKLNFFAAQVPSKFTDSIIIVQGSTRKTDDELVALRFMYENTAPGGEDGTEKLFYYFKLVMNSVFTDIDEATLDNMLTKAVSTDGFEISGDIAYRFSTQSINGGSYFILDFAPASESENLT